MRIKQILIALDQVLNALAGGWADETLSARAYRRRYKKAGWRRAMRVIDTLFFWQPHHCKSAWQAEAQRRQLPIEYRDMSREFEHG